MNCKCRSVCRCFQDAVPVNPNAEVLLKLLRQFPGKVEVTYDRTSSEEKIYVTEDTLVTYMVVSGKVYRQSWESVTL